jgi:hypothetical protein
MTRRIVVQGTIVDDFDLGIDVTGFGAIGDGVADDSPAFEEAIDSIPDAVAIGNSRTRNMGAIFIPNPPVAYRLATEVEIPSTKNVYFYGEGANGSRIISDVNYGFYVRNAATFRNRGFGSMLFDGCGVRVEDQTRNRHNFQQCFFKDTPDYAIKLMSAAEVLGASGGIVGGLIMACEFENCAGAIVCQGDQSDNWVVFQNQFTRQSVADIKIYSAGWRVLDNAFEQRWDANLDQPFINIAGDPPPASVNTSDILIGGNRFGNEIGGLGTQPPRECIVIGTIGAAETGVIPDIKILANYFRGRAGGGPTATSANAAIRINRATSFCKVRDNYFFPYNTTLIQMAHGGTDDGSGNVFEMPSEPNSVFGVNAHTPFFSPYTPARGSMGSWQTPGIEPEEEGIDRLIDDVNDIDGAAAWVKTNCTVVQDVTSHNGIANYAYTVDKLAAGSATLVRAIAAPDGRPVVCSARFRFVAGSDVDLCRFYVQNITAGNLFSGQPSATFSLKDDWQRQWIVIFPDAGDNITLNIGFGGDGSADTGEVEIDDVRVEYGTLPSSGGPNLVEYNTAAPVAGTYVVGDIVWNTAPAAGGTVGWVCTTGGTPGTWKAFGTIAV